MDEDEIYDFSDEMNENDMLLNNIFCIIFYILFW